MPTRRLAVALWLLGALVGRAADPPAEPKFADRTLSVWVKDLDDADLLIREEALEVLARLGPEAKPAVPRIEQLFHDGSESVRRRAALALWKIDGRTGPAVEVYKASLKSARGMQRVQAIQTLQQLGVPADELMPHLVAVLLRAEPNLYPSLHNLMTLFGPAAHTALAQALPKARGEVRTWLLGVLLGYGPSATKPLVPLLKELMRDPDTRARFAAARVLWALEEDRPAVVRLVSDAVADTNLPLRLEATQFALSLSPKPKELAPIYQSLVKGPNTFQRFQGIQAMWEIDRTTLKDNLPILIAALKEPGQPGNWLNACQTLNAIGPDAKDAVPALLALLERPEALSYGYTIGPALGRMGPAALEPVIKLMASPNVQLQRVGMQALAYFGPEVLTKIGPVLKTADAAGKRTIVSTLMRFGAACKPVLPELIPLLADPDPLIRQQVVTLIGQIGPDARDAVPELVKLLSSPQAGVAQASAVIRTLRQIGPAAKQAAPELWKWLDKDARPQRVEVAEATEALLSVDPSAKDEVFRAVAALMRGKEMVLPLQTLVPALLGHGLPQAELASMLTDYAKHSSNARANVASALTLAAIPPAMTPQLREWLKDPDARVRQESAFALARFGADGKDAVPALREALRQPATRDRAAGALIAIGPAAKDAAPDLLAQWRSAAEPADARLRLADTLLAVDPSKGAAVLEWVRQQAAVPVAFQKLNALRLLARHDAANPEVLRALQELTRESAPFYSAQAAELIGLLGEHGKPALPRLREMLKDAHPQKRAKAALALWKIEGKADAVVPVLREVLLQTDPALPGVMNPPQRSAAWAAAAALAEIGPPAKDALPALREAQKLPDVGLRQLATAAVTRIEGKN